MSLSRATISIASILLGLSAAAAQQLPGASMDGSMVVPSRTSTTLFNGAVPPNGFMVQAVSKYCVVNDNGPASGAGIFVAGGGLNGFTLPFTTPPGYKPMGPVSVWCNMGPVYVAARGW